VSSIAALTNRCLTSGNRSDSAVASQAEPHHTHFAPSASAAAIGRPSAISPAADASRLGHRRRHVATVRETKDRRRHADLLEDVTAHR
jgi:hypothetical protein